MTAWRSLRTLLSELPPERQRLHLLPQRSHLDVRQLTVAAPGEARATLRLVSFSVSSGQALGVIGPMGAGKSVLAQTVTGALTPAGGCIRLGCFPIGQFSPEALGRLVGYLSQNVRLLDGTIAQNIAGMRLDPDQDKVIGAARRAGAHDMISGLPDGYDTQITASGCRLSGGQIQQIGLARALFADPLLLVLDEPSTHLDRDGVIALNRVVREMKSDGKVVLIASQRPAALVECDHLLVLENGARKAFGPRESILRKMVSNHAQIRGARRLGSAE